MSHNENNRISSQSSRRARKRLHAILRMAHRVLGLGRRRLGLGSLTGGGSTGHVSTLIASSWTTRTHGFGVAAEVIKDWLHARALMLATVAFAWGASANATEPQSNVAGPHSVAIGENVIATGDSSIAIGLGSQAPGEMSLALGKSANAIDGYSVAIGSSAQATAKVATAIGNNSQASGEYSFAIGSSAQAAATRATAIGVGSEASGEYSFAAGDFAKATALNSTAVGGAEATRIEAIGIGQAAKALAQKSIAIGSYAKALDDFAIAHGRLAIASGGGAIALGAQAQATGTNATAIGGSNNGENHVLANAPGSTAIGASAADIGARAQGVDSVAIGGGAKVLASTKSDQDVIKAFNDAGLALNTAKVEANKTEVNKEQAKLRFDSASAHHKEVMNRLATAKEEVSAAQENRDAARKEYDQGKSKCKKVCLTKAEKALADARNKLTRLEKSNADDIKSAAKAEADAKNELDAAYADLDPTKVDNKVQKNLEELQQKFNTAKAALDAIKTISGGVAIGLNAEANPDAATAMGKDAKASADRSVALGSNATANNVGDVALGAGSETAAVVNTADTKISGKNYTFAGAKAKSTVSIGMRDAERTITNVAAGRITSASTDGINGSQLFATNQAIEALNDSSVKYDDQQKSRITLGATGGSGAPSGGVTITNLAVGKVSKDSKDAVNGGQLYAASAEFASSLGGGATVDPATGQVTKPLYLADKTGAGKKGYSTVGDALTAVHEMAGKGFDVAVKAVSGTASGGKVTVKPGDTVTYAAGDNIALTQTGNTIALATSLTPVFGTVTVGKNGADGALSTLGPDGLRITAKGADGKTTDGPSILASGIDAGGRTIAHVAAGKAETDAANLGQMKDAVAAAANPLGSSVNNLGGSVAGMLGGGSTFDPKTGKLSEPAFMVHDTRYNNVSGAITALDGGISNLMKDALQWNPAIGAYDASHGGSGPQRITNVANGSEANDAVNLSQLNAVAVRANAGLNVTTTQTGTGMASGNGTGAVVKPGDTVTYTAGNNIALTQNGGSIAIATSLTPAFTSVTTGNAKLETNGLIIANGPSVTAAGIDAASRAIRNVADGVAPTDAVNLGQLTALTASANNLGNNANALGTSTASNLGGGAKYNPTTGEVSSPGYGVGGTQYSSVGNAIEALQASAPMQYSLPTSPTVGAPGSAPTNDVTLVGSAGKAPTLHNINAGEVSATSTDAINGSQLHGSAQSVATTLGGESTVSSTGQIVGTRYNVAGASYNNVGSAMSAIDRRFDSIGGDIASLQNQISSNYRKANGGIALALASSGLRYDDRPGKVSVAAAASVYHSQIGIAAGVGWTSEDHQWRANLAGTYSPSQQKPDIGVVGGLSYTFD